MLWEIAAADDAKTLVLRDYESGFSFRYDRSVWHEEEPQYSNTLALLYADDGSQATCNVNAGPHKELANLSFEATNLFNDTNHQEETLSQNQKRVMSDVVVHDYSRGAFGLGYNGGILTYSGYPKNIPNMLAKGIAGSVFAQGYWIVVVCHQPVSQRTDLPETAKAGFDMIKGTLLHTER